MIRTISNLNRSPHWTETKMTHLGIFNDIFRAIDRGHNPGSGIWNNPSSLSILILSAYSSIYAKVED